MTQTTKGVDALTSLLLPALLLSALIGVIMLQTGLLEIPHRYAAAAAPQTVRIQPRAYSYRSGGEYLQDGIPVDGPLVDVASPPPLDVMKFEVSTVEYARCFAAGACRAAEPRGPSRDGLPVPMRPGCRRRPVSPGGSPPLRSGYLRQGRRLLIPPSSGGPTPPTRRTAGSPLIGSRLRQLRVVPQRSRNPPVRLVRMRSALPT